MHEVTATSLDQIIEMGATTGGDNRCYRGQSDASWNLVPSIFRPLVNRPAAHVQANLSWIARSERDLYREFELRGRSLFDLDEKWEILCLAQHHGAPTRLLDWTKNLLV